MSLSRLPWSSALLACTFALLAGTAPAQKEAPPTLHVPYEFDSGWLENTRSTAQVVISFPVVVEEAEWLRLYFEDLTLSGDLLAGNGAILRLTALEDGAVQEMDARHVAQWQNSSAYFNGDTVLVEVLAQPGSGWNRVAMRSVDMGLAPTVEETICGALDDRVLSNDPRAARILPIGCTGWLIDDCKQCFLTAGHCASGTSVLEFNVPLSSSGGALNHPSPDDQYSADAASMQTNGGQGTGNDWAYFGAFANTNTGLTPAQAAGSTYALVAPPPVAGNNIRITGYGTDSSPSTSNQVQQTHVGPMVTNSGSLVQYATDTTGGNSGSPVIWENTGQAVGIHTHGGCDSSGGQNSGTGSNHSGLQNALASPLGICAAGFTFPQGLPTLVLPDVPIGVQAQVLGSGSAVTLHYRLQGGAFNAQAMTSQGGGLYAGTIPAPGCGDAPEFYFSYQEGSCGLITSPAGAPASFYAAQVGTAQIALSDDFEIDMGWTTTVQGATTGAWERGVPVNDPNWTYDPISDSDGSGRCYLTQNQLGNTDVDGGSVSLISPVLDLSGAGTFVSYDYFLNLTIEDGVDRLLVEARNGAGAWSTVALHVTSGGLGWRTHSITQSDFSAAGIAASNDVQLRFTANDSGAASITEAGLDAFWVGGIACGGLGTNYCSSGQNGATISATGSASVLANDLVLQASGVLPNVNGLFFYGNLQANTPLGNGTLCISGTNGLFRLQPVLNSGPTGTMSKAVDLTNPPHPLGQVTVGSTWNYQLWFRQGKTSDLTDALSVLFLP
jgi:V8-like Glu-specific endopeptidase